MTELFIKTDDYEKATHEQRAERSVCGVNEMIISEIQRPKVIDLTSLVGSNVRFEFSDGINSWFEGYLHGIEDYGFRSGYKEEGRLSNEALYSCVRFAKYWEPHDGKSDCPWPEGVEYEVRIAEYIQECIIQPISSSLNYTDAWCWHGTDKVENVIASRPTGKCLDGWIMPGDKNE